MARNVFRGVFGRLRTVNVADVRVGPGRCIARIGLVTHLIFSVLRGVVRRMKQLVFVVGIPKKKSNLFLGATVRRGIIQRRRRRRRYDVGANPRTTFIF